MNKTHNLEMYKKLWLKIQQCVTWIWYPILSNIIKNKEGLCIANGLPGTQSAMSRLGQHLFEANSGLELLTLRGNISCTSHAPALWVVTRIHKHAEFLNILMLTTRGCRWNSQQSLTITVGVLLTTAPVHHTSTACIPRTPIIANRS